MYKVFTNMYYQNVKSTNKYQNVKSTNLKQNVTTSKFQKQRRGMIL